MLPTWYTVSAVKDCLGGLVSENYKFYLCESLPPSPYFFCLLEKFCSERVWICQKKKREIPVMLGKMTNSTFSCYIGESTGFVIAIFWTAILMCVCVCHGHDEVKGLHLEAVLKCMYRLFERKGILESWHVTILNWNFKNKYLHIEGSQVVLV